MKLNCHILPDIKMRNRYIKLVIDKKIGRIDRISVDRLSVTGNHNYCISAFNNTHDVNKITVSQRQHSVAVLRCRTHDGGRWNVYVITERVPWRTRYTRN